MNKEVINAIIELVKDFRDACRGQEWLKANQLVSDIKNILIGPPQPDFIDKAIRNAPPYPNPDPGQEPLDPYVVRIDDTDFYEIEDQERWQLVSHDERGAGHTYRLRVLGGWLYRTVTYRYPEAHALFEQHGSKDPYFENNDKGREKHRRWLAAQEILTQTTVFVPDA